MKLIYLHLYKDTYLIFMQAHKKLQSFKILKFLIKEKKYFQKLKVLTNSKIRALKEGKA